jgi:transmembrane sensor
VGALAARPPGPTAPHPAMTIASAEALPIEPAASAEAPRSTWRELARAGDNKAALAAAEAEDWGALCNSLSAADLLELGTIARLAGRSGRAIEAYSAVRRRFSGGDAAATAAFHLGQLAFDGAHAYADAHRWFTAYLAERPGGALAGEALGRTMEAEQRLGDLPAARETARRYLARYPNGAHENLAGSLIAP